MSKENNPSQHENNPPRNKSELKPEANLQSQPTRVTPTINSPFLEHLGIRLIRAEAGQAEVAVAPDDWHMNTWSVMHGGVIMTLLDAGMAMAARSMTDRDTGVVTVEMKTSFMQPGRGELTVFARVLHQSATMAFCDADVRDANGRFVAKGLGTFKYVRALAVGREVTAAAS